MTDENIIRKNEGGISRDVLADRIAYGKSGGYTKDWKINAEPVTLGVSKNADEEEMHG